jgi:protein phosphatase
MKITLPAFSLVVLVGPSGCGKSTFAGKHFKPTEVLSSDFCRGLVCDDDTNQESSADAFEVLHFVCAKRLARARLTVIDATNVQVEARKPLLALAKRYHCLPVAIVLDLPVELCTERNRQRPGRDFGTHVVRAHVRHLRHSLGHLEKEGFRKVFVLSSPEEIDAAVVERQPLWNDLRHEHGPFDLIGDVHGCFDELLSLLRQLGYAISEQNDADGNAAYAVQPPAGRKAVFVGDLVDRGPKVPQVLRLVMDMVASGVALCVQGNHDHKLHRKLRGADVKVAHGLAQSLAQLEGESAAFRDRVSTFLDGLISHYVLDDGKLVVAHAGLKEELQGRASGAVRSFCLYGETTGETDEFGLPVRLNWASEYRGRATVVYRRTPVPHPEWLNRTINIDTGCVFWGRLTALRYPEKELISTPALQTYSPSSRPFLAPKTASTGLTAQQGSDDLLAWADFSGKRVITTRLHGDVLLREENVSLALEVMSRFAADPRWLIYLPPTMAPAETSKEPGLLEHPAEAFSYFKTQGVQSVVCEEKHMGSRAVVIACHDETAARRRFGVDGAGAGVCYTRTGRRFFENAALENEFITLVRNAATAVDFWSRFETDWFCLDAELLPWSVKAQELLRRQYAAVGAAARAALAEVNAAFATSTGADLAALRESYRSRAESAERFTAAYRRYCWPVASVSDLRLAPFHLLATEGRVHCDQNHVWHMERLAELCQVGAGLLVATPFKVIDVNDPEAQAQGQRWWEELTNRGGEGMVVKSFDFATTGQRGLVQPALKCRGREYLRIIYGPEYDDPRHLERLRIRAVGGKRRLAAREFALGIEGLERFVRREPLRRVHECALGVLALESDPIDPRL